MSDNAKKLPMYNLTYSQRLKQHGLDSLELD